jgi:hypothetical protein
VTNSTVGCFLHTPFHKKKSQDRIPCFGRNHTDAVQTDGSNDIDISQVVLGDNVREKNAREQKSNLEVWL